MKFLGVLLTLLLLLEISNQFRIITEKTKASMKQNKLRTLKLQAFSKHTDKNQIRKLIQQEKNKQHQFKMQQLHNQMVSRSSRQQKRKYQRNQVQRKIQNQNHQQYRKLYIKGGRNNIANRYNKNPILKQKGYLKDREAFRKQLVANFSRNKKLNQGKERQLFLGEPSQDQKIKNQNDRFMEIYSNMIKDWHTKYSFYNHLNDIENDTLKEVHEAYLTLKGKIRETKNSMELELQEIFNNYIVPNRRHYQFNYILIIFNN